MHMVPPTVTAQEHRVTVVNGKPVFYDTPRIRDAKKILMEHLYQHRPEQPFEGPLSLHVKWLFPKGKNHKNGEWRVTRPDTDNLQKILKDAMTKTGFWKDDAQVARELVEKRWADESQTGIYVRIEMLSNED